MFEGVEVSQMSEGHYEIWQKFKDFTGMYRKTWWLFQTHTYKNINFKDKSEADALLFKFLGQLLTTLHTKTEKLDGDTT